jgi:opacity protein-like surface antigen
MVLPTRVSTSTRLGYAALAAGVVACLLSAIARADPDLPLEVGWDYGDLETPRVAALGGAVRAFSHSVDAFLVNPATMAATPVYHVGGFLEIWPEANRQSYGGAIVDSVMSSSKLAGGLGGAYTRQNPENLGREAADLRLALAFPFSEQFMIGAGGRYLRMLQNGDGPLGPSLVSGGLRKQVIVDGFGLDLGAMLRLGDSFRLALVGNNINSPDNGVQPASVSGGLGYGIRDFTVEADILADFVSWEKTTARAMLGLELLVAHHYPLRLGYRYDTGAESHALSAGAGYLDQAFGFDVAVRRVVSGDVATAVFVSFVYHVESTGLTPSGSDAF